MISTGRGALVWWIVLAILTAIVVFAFRGYLSAEAVIDFANQRLC